MRSTDGTWNVPDKPTLDGLEATWVPRWDEAGTYAFDRSAERADRFIAAIPQASPFDREAGRHEYLALTAGAGWTGA